MNLDNILKDLQKYKHENRAELLTKYIEERLTKSVNTYYNELSKNVEYLYNKDDLRLVRKINRLE